MFCLLRHKAASNARKVIFDRLTILGFDPGNNKKVTSIHAKFGFWGRVSAYHIPNDKYNVAINYADSRWGGNSAARTHIIKTAEKNNPETLWVEAMKREYAEDGAAASGEGLVDDLIEQLKRIF